MTIARIRRNGAPLYAPKNTFIRWCLPYGVWTCPDEREVLFDRDYTPICPRLPGAAPSFADREEWVLWIKQHWFYTDVTPERAKKAAALAILAEWGFTDPVMAQVEEMTRRKHPPDDHSWHSQVSPAMERRLELGEPVPRYPGLRVR